MFEIEFKSLALRQLKDLKRYYAIQIVSAIEKYLKFNPDKPSIPRIKRLRGYQKATYRLREGDYRIFYDVDQTTVTVVAILHKTETAKFYSKEETL